MWGPGAPAFTALHPDIILQPAKDGGRGVLRHNTSWRRTRWEQVGQEGNPLADVAPIACNITLLSEIVVAPQSKHRRDRALGTPPFSSAHTPGSLRHSTPRLF